MRIVTNDGDEIKYVIFRWCFCFVWSLLWYYVHYCNAHAFYCPQFWMIFLFTKYLYFNTVNFLLKLKKSFPNKLSCKEWWMNEIKTLEFFFRTYLSDNCKNLGQKINSQYLIGCVTPLEISLSLRPFRNSERTCMFYMSTLLRTVSGRRCSSSLTA